MNGFIKGTLLVAALAGVGTGGYFGYKKITDQDKKIKNLEIENTQLKEDVENKTAEISELNSRLKTKSDELAEKNKALESAMSELAESEKYKIKLQNDLNEKTTQLESANGKISVLSTQKVSLLNAVTEIDNKINSTESSVEIETLEERKSAILTQIDDLNTQIDKLTTDKQSLQTEVDNLKVEKQNLQTEIAQLQEQKTQLENEIVDLNNQISELNEQVSALRESALHLVYTESYLNNFLPGNSLPLASRIYKGIDIVDINNYYMSSRGEKREFTYFNLVDYPDMINNLLQGKSSVNNCTTRHYECNIDNQLLKIISDLPNTFINVNSYKVFYKGEEVTDSSSFNQYKTYIMSVILEDNNLSIYLDDVLFGKYASSDGDYIDFDNFTYSVDGTTGSCYYPTIDFSTSTNYGKIGYVPSLDSPSSSTYFDNSKFIVGEENSFVCNGKIFIKEEMTKDSHLLNGTYKCNTDDTKYYVFGSGNVCEYHYTSTFLGKPSAKTTKITYYVNDNVLIFISTDGSLKTLNIVDGSIVKDDLIFTKSEG